MPIIPCADTHDGLFNDLFEGADEDLHPRLRNPNEMIVDVILAMSCFSDFCHFNNRLLGKLEVLFAVNAFSILAEYFYGFPVGVCSCHSIPPSAASPPPSEAFCIDSADNKILVQLAQNPAGFSPQ